MQSIVAWCLGHYSTPEKGPYRTDMPLWQLTSKLITHHIPLKLSLVVPRTTLHNIYAIGSNIISLPMKTAMPPAEGFVTNPTIFC